MEITNVPHDAWILVANGAKATVLVNNGDPERLDLRVLEVSDLGDAPTDAARARNGACADRMKERRASFEETDWHKIEKTRFAREVARSLDRHYAAQDFRWLAVFAPPSTLEELRRALSPETRSHVVQTVAKDLTRHPIPEVERILYEL